jgi:hypothetical protein
MLTDLPYDDQAWIDYIRGLGFEVRRLILRIHLITFIQISSTSVYPHPKIRMSSFRGRQFHVHGLTWA